MTSFEARCEWAPNSLLRVSAGWLPKDGAVVFTVEDEQAEEILAVRLSKADAQKLIAFLSTQKD